MKKVLLTLFIIIALLGCRTYIVDSNYSDLSKKILENSYMVEIKISDWDHNFKSKEPEYSITDEGIISNLAEVMSETLYTFGDMLECGYTGSMIFYYNDDTTSPVIYFNASCGSFEFRIGDKQFPGILTSESTQKLYDIIINL